MLWPDLVARITATSLTAENSRSYSHALTMEQDQSCAAAQAGEDDAFFIWHSPSNLPGIRSMPWRKRIRDQLGPSLPVVPFTELQQLQIVLNCSTEVMTRKTGADSG